MKKELQLTFDELESQRAELLKEVISLSQDELTKSPEGKWSIIHILSHIVAGERAGLEYVRKKVLGVREAGESGMWEGLKLALFKASQRIPFLKYKAPRVLVDRTIVYNDLSTLELEWENIRRDWRSFLDKLPDEFSNKKIFRHAVGGRFNVRQGLVILREHINHHIPQIRERMR